MIGFELSPEKLQQLKIAHRKTRNKKHAYKINAIILLGSGWTLEHTAEALQINIETLRNYVTKYKDGGLNYLLATLYVGKPAMLSPSQQEKLSKHLEQNLYRTTAEIINHVHSEYCVLYKPSGMKKMLNSLGFSYKKPKLVPCKLDPVKQEEFEEVYRKFMERKSDKESVVFYDSAHPQHMTTCDHGWIKKGKDFPLANNVGRNRLNISGCVDIETLDVIAYTPDKVNSDSSIEMFKKIEACYPEQNKIHIILDNASCHKSKVVKDFIASSKINLVYLPPYSPNLNPMERIWRLMRDEILSNKFYSKFTEFKEACTNFLISLLDKKDKLCSLISDEFQDLPAVINSS